ncbi:hypothetical protein [Umezawaea sp. NPDC059074]|uniref:hypothetical protein n=1 Tax=Umezawaea sp. NPDC059074 TaxID=3346716 RepID=UPI0036CDDB39
MTTEEPRRPRARWVLPTALVVAAASVAGGFLARDLYTRTATVSTTTTSSSVSSAPTSVPRSEQPGDRTVRLSVDAGLHPDGDRVRGLLQQYFDAINDRNYQAWSDSVTTEVARRLREPQWESNYQTTADGSVEVQRIDASSAERLRVMISFVSVQDVSKAPADLPVDCIRWHVVFPLQGEDGTLRVDIGPEGYTPQFEAC